MAKRRVLSPFSFYGGKDRMAPLICEMLDYEHTVLYMEPFGGACRVLLNKPRHAVEIYNDFGYGLVTFFETLGNRELSQVVLDTLAKLTPDEELFNQMKSYKLEHEQELTDNMRQQFQKFVWKCWKEYRSEELWRLHKAVSHKDYKSIMDISQGINSSMIKDGRDMQTFQDFLMLYRQYWDIVKEDYQKEFEKAKKDFEKEWKKQKAGDKRVIRDKEKFQYGFCHGRALDKIADYTSDILISNGSEQDDPVQMAVATFITYYLSRDGMGLEYSAAKDKSIDRYYLHLQNLKDVAERFEGVEVLQVSALLLIELYCQCEYVMMYLDPSYLKPEDEDKDLGEGIYNRSFGREEHERLANIIKDAKAKIILSNYEVEPYLSILSEDMGWKKYYYDTHTSVGNKRDNKRTEVLWYNY